MASYNQQPQSPPPYYVPAPADPPPLIHAPSTTTTVNVTPGGLHVPGSCPVCHGRSWTGTYPCMAWLLCFFCFWNCGLCCCLCMRRKKCTKCGFTVA